ncbi:hypothetical protein [Streptomyces sp. NPDC054887]
MTVTAAQGLSASGVPAGVKESGHPGLAPVVERGPSRAAAGEPAVNWSDDPTAEHVHENSAYSS